MSWSQRGPKPGRSSGGNQSNAVRSVDILLCIVRPGRLDELAHQPHQVQGEYRGRQIATISFEEDLVIVYDSSDREMTATTSLPGNVHYSSPTSPMPGSFSSQILVIARFISGQLLPSINPHNGRYSVETTLLAGTCQGVVVRHTSVTTSVDFLEILSLFPLDDA